MSQLTSKMIIGLGNPGSIYERTRHNAGKIMLTNLAKRYWVNFQNDKYGQIANIQSQSCNSLLYVPDAYMNLSGLPIKQTLKQFKIETNNFIVVIDDLDLELGKVKFKQKGSSKGHRGVKSIIDELRDDNFGRILIGIGRPNSKDKEQISKFVLDKFESSEIDILENQCYQKMIEFIKQNGYM